MIIAINYIEQIYGDVNISMCGFSGGGWTTTIAAAIDPRIKNSFPVAGSLPVFLIANTRVSGSPYLLVMVLILPLVLGLFS